MSHRSTHLEFDFTDAEFDRLRHMVRRHTGIHLSSAKRELVYGRLSRRVRCLSLLATDIDSQVLATARQGRYEQHQCEGLSGEHLTRWFRKSTQAPPAYQANKALQRIIRFTQLNLFEPWPMSGPFQVIFCRNVAIYFDKTAQRDLFDRMADLQEPGAWLFIGHSESLFGVTNRYKAVGRTIYRRVA